MAGYNPKKAAAYNKLRQQGLSEDQAARQAGISEAEDRFYETNEVGSNNPKDASYNPNFGKMGPPVQGANAAEYNKAIASGKTEQQAFAELEARRAEAKAERAASRDEDADDETFERSPVAINEKTPPNTRVVTQTVTTETETVSGGGSRTTVSGPKVSTAGSEALQPAINAKQAEIDQFNKDNPSPFARKKQGLPPLTPEENEARIAKQSELNDQATRLRNGQTELKADTPPTVTTVPNTTTTTQTVTTSTSSTNQAVNPINDEKLSQENETQLEATTSAANATTARSGTPVSPEDDPFEAERLEREQELNRQELAEQTAEPAAVTDDPTVYPTDEETIAQDANQAAARAQLQAADAQEAAAQQAVTLDKARAQNTIANQRSNKNNADWRVKLRLAPLADYLYMAKPPGILAPLAPDGVIFPYTPTIQTSYKATYVTTDITHSNYKGYFYQGSAVEPFTISSTFTAQSTAEAEYLLAVIHFFKSVTKMFYGQDPQRGTPPPLVYLTGLGEFQFNEHPCVVSGFTYDLPADVDYIRAYSPNVNNSNMLQQRQSNNSTGPGTSWGNGILGGVLGGAVNRLASSKLFNGQPLPKGGQNIPPAPQTLGSNTIPTYVPTKMTISVSLLPVVSRQAQSQRFSVRQYATGDLLKGGMW